MRKVWLVAACLINLLTLTAHAEIFRWVDADGNVMYGDNPPKRKGVKPVELPMLTVADPPPSSTPTQSPPPATEEASAYSEFKIATPSANEAIRDNAGNFSINLNIQPALQSGDAVTVYLDGKQVGNGVALSYNVTNVDRGEHSVFAVLNNSAGDIIQNTETVKFSILRFARSPKS